MLMRNDGWREWQANDEGVRSNGRWIYIYIYRCVCVFGHRGTMGFYFYFFKLGDKGIKSNKGWWKATRGAKVKWFFWGVIDEWLRMTKGDGTWRRTMGTNKGKQLALRWTMKSNRGQSWVLGRITRNNRKHNKGIKKDTKHVRKSNMHIEIR